MIKLRWAQFPESQVSSYRIYRSIVGFVAPLVDLAGKTLQLKMNGGSVQTFNFVAGSAIDQINATIVGGRAYQAANLTSFFLRSDLRSGPTATVQIVGGTAMALLGLTARIISEKSEDTQIAQIPSLLDPTQLVEFQDPDGVLQDWYAVSTVDQFANESLKTSYMQAISATGPLCVIEGIIMTLQGARVPDATITAQLQVPPEGIDNLSNITTDAISTISDTDGRFSLALLQGAIVKFECEKVGLSRMIHVPALAYAFVNDIKVDLDYRNPLGFKE